ncbi:hypothetical protein J2Z76_000238 [Sedimentibacter acidaminivorans]|jgi:hypothetical protein|uniref:Phage holin, LL-H family n=1 Tax=Sedimentibacter acidaminivorans TaxID=913099 RepID=A0ABS4G9M2_9FIRM|nr:hypothetical protein [Sedimentibacter acidaminivorans]MBP1924385.1 hypothetical protein [Sedimentibacter acidaminivorans]
MDLDLIMQFVVPLIAIILGAASAYYHENEKIRNSSIKYIAQAEDMYKDTIKSGGQKFQWVVDTIYNIVPAPFKIILTKKMIERIVQSTFDGLEEYAKLQLEKALNNYVKNQENESRD